MEGEWNDKVLFENTILCKRAVYKNTIVKRIDDRFLYFP